MGTGTPTERVTTFSTSTVRVTTRTSACLSRLARRGSQGRWRHDEEHHDGTRPRAGTSTARPHHPHSTVCPRTPWELARRALGSCAFVGHGAPRFVPTSLRRPQHCDRFAPGVWRMADLGYVARRRGSRQVFGERVYGSQFEAGPWCSRCGALLTWGWVDVERPAPTMGVGLWLFVTVFLLFCVLLAILVCEQDFFSPRVRDVGPRCSYGSRGLLRSRTRPCRYRQPCRTGRPAYQ